MRDAQGPLCHVTSDEYFIVGRYILKIASLYGTLYIPVHPNVNFTHTLHPHMQTPKDWHLFLIVLLITSIGVAAVVGKSISQRRPPTLIRDNEDRDGRMV